MPPRVTAKSENSIGHLELVIWRQPIFDVSHNYSPRVLAPCWGNRPSRPVLERYVPYQFRADDREEGRALITVLLTYPT